MYTTAFIAALVGVVAADRIPLKHNPLTIADWMSQKAQIEKRAQLYGATGEHVAMKDYMNTQYFIDIQLGSDKQNFTVVPDTGSSNLWVYSSNCHAIACKTHSSYNPDSSSTYEADGQDFNITYGSGSIEGYVSRDNAYIGDAAYAAMGFGEVQKVKGATFLISQMDGIIGLAFDTISVDGLPTFIEQSDLTEKTFSFYLENNPEESYMVIPGIDEDKGYTVIKEHQVIEETYWNVAFDSMTGPNGTQDTTGYKAAIDSGTSLIMGPNSILAPLIEGIEVAQDCTGIESLPDIIFTFDGIDYTLTYEDYVLQEQDGKQCIMGIMGADLPEDFKYVIVGDVFMRAYPTKFDRDNKTVTFYQKN